LGKKEVSGKAADRNHPSQRGNAGGRDRAGKGKIGGNQGGPPPERGSGEIDHHSLRNRKRGPIRKPRELGSEAGLILPPFKRKREEGRVKSNIETPEKSNPVTLREKGIREMVYHSGEGEHLVGKVQ